VIKKHQIPSPTQKRPKKKVQGQKWYHGGKHQKLKPVKKGGKIKLLAGGKE